jgi:glutathione synthase/RimK-type ligase-like ATP-grasp enzyme
VTLLALATCAEYPRLLEDDASLVAALAGHGVEVEPATWDEPRDWTRVDAVLLRSVWDYYRRPDEFLAWLAALERAGVPTFNPPALVRWNADKRYLGELEARGVPVPPTLWFERGADAGAAAQTIAASGWDDLVVKPTISGGAWRTLRLAARDVPRHVRHLETVLADSGLMAQPFLPEVVERGEVSLLFFGGAYSHAVLKRARPGDFRVQWTHGGTHVPLEAPPGLVEQARAVLRAAPEPGLYARVDGVLRDGRLVLMELEQLEPFLFLALDPGAGARLAAALLRALEGGAAR